MKKSLTVLFIIACLFNGHNAYAGSLTSKIKEIRFYGGEWGNAWSGSILYRLDTMPAGVTYFYVKPTDIAFQTYTSVLLSAKHANKAITVHYREASTNGSGYTPTTVIIQQ
jgi:hypothetical protein